ncbi:MAG: hypothetical protein M3N57_06700 [Actinomycetota bacterium]|nr:hypothetical protein [Actinomycetota bacterium]
MAVSVGRRLAARAPVPVLAVAGAGARDALLGLRAADGVDPVHSPRHATVLLVGGVIPGELFDAVAHVHDQLPEPRSVVWWGGDDAGTLGIDGTVAVAPDGDVLGTIQRVHGELVTGERPSTAPVGPAANPVEWRGVGPHGHGGEGMMGGQPYGRRMAMTGPDRRDGLQLDRVPLQVGPALPGFPPGLVLDVELQGDVIQQARSAANPFESGQRVGSPLRSVGDVFDTARRRPVRVAEMELARARYHLLRLAEALQLHGLASGGRRVARLAVQLRPSDRQRIARLRRWLERGVALWGATAGVGRLDAGTVEDLGVGGVVARAAGVPVDARAEDRTYRALGFQTTTRQGGDARARWLQRIDEAVQAVQLATAAADATVGADHGVEDPRAGTGAVLAQLPQLLAGLEWGDAVTTIASLDLDLEAAAGVPPVSSVEWG